MKLLLLSAAGLVTISSVACSNLDFKSTLSRTGTDKKSAQRENASPAPNSSNAASEGIAKDETSGELERLLAASGENVTRSLGNMGIVPGCPASKPVSTSTVSSGGGGWGGGTSQTITNEVVNVKPCVAAEIKTEPFAFCQIRTASGELVECLKWSSVGGANKKNNEGDCKAQADKSSGITTSSIGQRSTAKGQFLFVCQKL
ncbi:hypothetical protein EBU99_13585 [bacterium]|nr:hypothetical protein [bacterium]